MKKVLIIIFIFGLFIQCNHQYEYSDMKNVNNTWTKKDTLKFNFNIKAPKAKKNVNFIVRNNNDYPFSNIYLFIKLSNKNEIISIDTLNYRLADNTGKWLGSGVGSVKEIYLKYKEGLEFPDIGDYTLSIVQGMRNDTLAGIEDFGITIE